MAIIISAVQIPVSLRVQTGVQNISYLYSIMTVRLLLYTASIFVVSDEIF